jgi:hypothetical protein
VPSSTPATTASSASSAYAASAPANGAPVAAVPPTVINPKALGDEFESNQIAAEHKWGGKFIQFTSPVGNINSSGVSFQSVTSKFSFTQISCKVKDENQLLSLSKGKPATVRGIVDDDQLLGVITINDCEVIG